ncbi:MAG: hypothetical protein II818_01390 [Aeriscardovia sp.]|nr:hypothetical protein [Aeriscardovia sp.]
MKLRCKKWCKEYGIPEERVNLKFWLGVRYWNTEKEVKALKKAQKEPVPPAPEL